MDAVVSGIEGAVKMDVEKNQVMMRTLDPVLEAGLTVSEVLREAEGKVTYKLTHPNGSLVSKIISEKIAEPEEKKSKGEVQVQPQTQFLTVSFMWKIIDLPWGQINDPSLGKHFSLPFFQETP